MKCQELLITGLVVLALTLSINPMTLNACESNSQSDTGGSSNANGDSNGKSASGTDTGGSNASGRDSSGTQQSSHDGNGPWVDRSPCGDWLIYGDTDWCRPNHNSPD